MINKCIILHLQPHVPIILLIFFVYPTRFARHISAPLPSGSWEQQRQRRDSSARKRDRCQRSRSCLPQEALWNSNHRGRWSSSTKARSWGKLSKIKDFMTFIYVFGSFLHDGRQYTRLKMYILRVWSSRLFQLKLFKIIQHHNNIRNACVILL